MKRVWKVIRWTLVASATVFVLAQFIRPAKTNPVAEASASFESHLEVDARVSAILDRACADCHSNNTRWPWYSQLSPISWWVVDHVREGRKELNFSEWGTYSRVNQSEKLRQICREVKSGSMPLRSYTRMHPASELTPEDVKTLCDWTDAQRTKLQATTIASFIDRGSAEQLDTSCAQRIPAVQFTF